MRRISVGVRVGVLWLGCAAVHAGAAETAAPRIQFGDVQRFYRIYDAAGGHPDADRLQHAYIEAGSDGLRYFSAARNITGGRIAAAVAGRRELYSGARRHRRAGGAACRSGSRRCAPSPGSMPISRRGSCTRSSMNTPMCSRRRPSWMTGSPPCSSAH